MANNKILQESPTFLLFIHYFINFILYVEY